MPEEQHKKPKALEAALKERDEAVIIAKGLIGIIRTLVDELSPNTGLGEQLSQCESRLSQLSSTKTEEDEV